MLTSAAFIHTKTRRVHLVTCTQRRARLRFYSGASPPLLELRGSRKVERRNSFDTCSDCSAALRARILAHLGPLTAQIKRERKAESDTCKGPHADERVRTGEADACARLQEHTRQVPDVITDRAASAALVARYDAAAADSCWRN